MAVTTSAGTAFETPEQKKAREDAAKAGVGGLVKPGLAPTTVSVKPPGAPRPPSPDDVLSKTIADFEGRPVAVPPPIPTPTVAPTRFVDKIDPRNVPAGSPFIPSEKVQVTADTSVAAPTIDPAALARTGTGTASTIARGPQGEIRERQMTLAELLTAAAEGRGPSAAQAQFATALGDVAAEQFGLVGQARGAQRAGLRREALLGIGRQGQRAAFESAALKAQEQIQARGQLASTLAATRATDVELATSQANLEQDMNKLNLSLGADISKFNADQLNSLTQLKAKLELEASQGNRDAALKLASLNGELKQRGIELDTSTQLKKDEQELERNKFIQTENRIIALDNAGREAEADELRARLASDTIQRQIDQFESQVRRLDDREKLAFTTKIAIAMRDKELATAKDEADRNRKAARWAAIFKTLGIVGGAVAGSLVPGVGTAAGATAGAAAGAAAGGLVQ